MSNKKYYVKVFTDFTEDEFKRFIKHVKEEHTWQELQIKEDNENIYYWVEDKESGTKELLAVETKEEEQALPFM